MRFWWVNQKQTHRQEIAGGYLWSPKRNANGVRNPFYDSMREVAPGNLIFSYFETYVQAIGVAISFCFDSPKPLEFGSAGRNWEDIGWCIKVRFHRLKKAIKPKEHIDFLRPLLPAKYAPLQANGNGVQAIYLTELPAPFAEALMAFIGFEADQIANEAREVNPIASDDLDLWEHKIEREVEANQHIPETDRESLVRARRGQGIFKERVQRIETRCRITGVDNPTHLIASHCKPWRSSNNEERLDGENGLLFTPSIDHLFDRGFIGFEDNGRLLISPAAHSNSLKRMGVVTDEHVNVGRFSEGQKRYLDFHRENVLLRSRRS